MTHRGSLTSQNGKGLAGTIPHFYSMVESERSSLFDGNVKPTDGRTVNIGESPYLLILNNTYLNRRRPGNFPVSLGGWNPERVLSIVSIMLVVGTGSLQTIVCEW